MNVLPLSQDAVHIYIGLAVFLGSVAIWKKGHIQSACLVPGFAIGFGMESFDLVDDWRSLGYVRWGASIHDIINTVFWPLVIIALVKFRAIN